MTSAATAKIERTVALFLCTLGILVAGGSPQRLAAAGAAPTSQDDKKKLNSDLLDLPPNTWVKIKPNRNPEGRSYSGICWGNGLIFYFGGYHGSYTCNDVELYDVAANTWTQATEPEDWRDCDQWTYLTAEQVKLVKDNARGTNYPGILSNLLVRCGLWAFDPARREWREVAKQLPEGRDLSGYGLYYDPGLKAVFAIIAGGDKSGAYVFNPEKKAWALKCKLPSGNWSEVHAAYDSTRKVHVVHTQRKWYDLDLVTATFKPIKCPDEVMKAAGKFPANPNELQEVSMVYDPQSQATLVVTKKNGHSHSVPVDLWAYDAGKNDWSEAAMNGPSPTGLVWWGLLVYDADHKCCLFLNLLGVQGSARWGGPVSGLFAFRLNKE